MSCTFFRLEVKLKHTFFKPQGKSKHTPCQLNETLHFLTSRNPKHQKKLKLRSTKQLPEYGEDVNSA